LTGRFTARDPFPGRGFDPATLHSYVYASNDPVNRVDPTGLAGETEISLAAAVAIAGDLAATAVANLTPLVTTATLVVAAAPVVEAELEEVEGELPVIEGVLPAAEQEVELVRQNLPAMVRLLEGLGRAWRSIPSADTLIVNVEDLAVRLGPDAPRRLACLVQAALDLVGVEGQLIASVVEGVGGDFSVDLALMINQLTGGNTLCQ
jgi:hypothetical protein